MAREYRTFCDLKRGPGKLKDLWASKPIQSGVALKFNSETVTYTGEFDGFCLDYFEIKSVFPESSFLYGNAALFVSSDRRPLSDEKLPFLRRVGRALNGLPEITQREACFAAGTHYPIKLVGWGKDGPGPVKPYLCRKQHERATFDRQDYLQMIAYQMGQVRFPQDKDTISDRRLDTAFLEEVFSGAEERLLAFAEAVAKTVNS
jgi:hypothetical protein